MRKYKLNKEHKEVSPTEKQTESYKDFAQLSHAYDGLTKRRKKPLYKDPKAFLALLLIIVVVWLVYEEFGEKEQQSPDNGIEESAKQTDKNINDSLK